MLIDEHELLDLLAESQGGGVTTKPPQVGMLSPFNATERVHRFLTSPAMRVRLQNNQDVLDALDEFRVKRQEHLVCLSVGAADRLIALRVVTIGTLTASIAHPREVFADPLADRAAYIIIAHNHPSGRAWPSDKDIELTQQIAAAGQILGIPLRDHFVITKSGYFSFRQQGYLLDA